MKSIEYIGLCPKVELDIDQIFSIHYFEYFKDFSYSGEAHDFWEFVYVDKGAIEALGGNSKYNLIKGDIIFHQPNEFHNLNSNGRIAPNLVIISFSTKSSGITWFRNKVLRISNEEKNLLARIIHEAGNAFSSELNDPWLPGLKRKKKQIFASEHLIKLYLEQFLIGLVRRELHITESSEPISPLREKTNNDAFSIVIGYFEKNILEMSNLETVCRETGYSCTHLENVFKEKTGRSVMEYYKIIKLERAKDLIREGDYSFTQIASFLNYSSIHYFSKIFKKYIGMTPSEYSSSVKLRL
ncbi:MAG: AraC family transcriptional regulator [Spirochaetes bacterium]|nr:MAG: AraC family transcriptional regulator [Spirochaetota bacterium]RKX83682.1 MAG: AraC family transcriptional regulator [Spirochaetota bacterium]